MNRICDLHGIPKGTPCEIKGTIIYEKAPAPARYGRGFSQFIVIEDVPGDRSSSVGANVSVSSLNEGYQKDERVLIRGKVDKYPDRSQPINTQDGTYPMKTSVKVEYIERFTEPQDFLQEMEMPSSQENVMDEQDFKAANTTPPGYVNAKAEEKAMWAKKDLIVAKQSACKTVGKWISNGKIELIDYFGWCNRLVDYFYNKDDKFAVITEANLMVAGLVEVNKAQATDWILTHMKGTDVGQDLCGILHVKELDKQTLKELLETIQKLSLAI